MCNLSFILALSMHVGFAGDYNGVHPGIQCSFDQSPVIAGVYLNSEKKPSAYLAMRFENKRQFWVEAGAVTGYAYPVIPMVRAGYKDFFVSPGMEVGSNKVGVVFGIQKQW